MSRHRCNARTPEAKARLKRLLAKRDGARCFYCRRPFPALSEATFDHYIPRSLWRCSKRRNLVLACAPCNHAKGDTLPLTVAALLLRNVRQNELWWRACMPTSAALYEPAA